jgi:hypothetical protein
VSVLFIGLAFIISSFVILYGDDHVFSDMNISHSVVLVLMLVGGVWPEGLWQ